jgi:hypothetical protein
MATLIGAGRVTLSADTTAFHTGFRKAEVQAKTSSVAISKSLGLIKAGFAGLATGLSIGVITRGIQAGLEYAGSLGEVAQQLGVTTKELQTFRYAAQQNGATMGEADQALGKFSIAISKALSGSVQMTKAFKAVGVSLDDLKTKSKAELIGQIADEMIRTGGASANAAAGVALFGRGFQKIIPTLDQGSRGLNELSAAAEKLGIVLSDEQIQKADETADKMDALKTVLSARIAGTVADNADAILALANALAQVAAISVQAAANFGKFLSMAARGVGFLANPTAEIGKLVAGPGKSQTRALRTVKPGTYYDPTNFSLGDFNKNKGGGDLAQFLAPKAGGGAKAKRGGSDDAMRKQLNALSDSFRFEEDIRRAQLDVLRAQEQLATDYSERARLAIEQLNLEKQSYEAELAYQVEAFKISKGQEGISQAQADQLKAQYDIRDSLERQLVLREEEERRQRDFAMLEDRDFEARREILERHAELANSSAERRDVELRILDLAYQEERNRLERIMRESQDWAEIEAARRDLLDLTQKQGLDREITKRNTAGPLEQAKMDFSDLTDEMENLRVNGIMAAGDALATLATEGFGSFKDQAISAIKAVIAEFIRLQTIKAIFSVIGAATGTPTAGLGGIGGMSSLYGGIDPMFLTGFATGGFTGMGPRDRIAGVVHTQEGVLNPTGMRTLGIPNLNALNSGSPLAAVSNDNGSYGGAMSGDNHFHFPQGTTPQQARESGLQASRAFKRGMAYGVRGRKS